MDQRLVRPEARGGRAEGVLHSGKSARRARGGELRPLPAAHQDSPQGAQRRLVPVRAQLLPPLSARRAPRATGRHVDVSRWLPMPQAAEARAVASPRTMDHGPMDRGVRSSIIAAIRMASRPRPFGMTWARGAFFPSPLPPGNAPRVSGFGEPVVVH